LIQRPLPISFIPGFGNHPFVPISDTVICVDVSPILYRDALVSVQLYRILMKMTIGEIDSNLAGTRPIVGACLAQSVELPTGTT